MATNKRDFDKEAAGWDENPVRVQLAADVFGAIRGKVRFDKAMRVLDFGCGTGLVTLHIAPLVCSVTGADSSQGMLAVLCEKAVRQGVSNIDTQLLESDDGKALAGSYDVIVSSMTLHHVENVAPLLARFKACLVPGGHLCIADLDPDGGRFHGDPAGVFHNGFEREDLRRLFLNAGFEGVSAATAAEVRKPGADGEMHVFTVFLMSGRKAPAPR